MTPDREHVDRLRCMGETERQRLEKQEVEALNAAFEGLAAEGHVRELTTVEMKEQRQLSRALQHRQNRKP